MLIGISGKARSGKDTFTGMLLDALEKKQASYIKMAYADDLKERVMKDFDLTYDQVYGDLKEVPDHRYCKPGSSAAFSSNPYEAFWTPREILQYMGTEGYRHIDSKFWIKQLFKKIDSSFIKNVIITDCRFPDEVDAVLEAGGIHIRVTRRNKDFVADTSHSSETSLDKYSFCNYTIKNDYDYFYLNIQAEEIANLIVKEEINNKTESGGK